MNICLLDTETTGPDRKKDRPWQVGAMLVRDSWEPIPTGEIEVKIWASDYPDISEGARRVCKISTERLDGPGILHPKLALQNICSNFLSKADYVLAYNHEFDKTILEEECSRQGVVLPDITWLCGMLDVPYAEYFRCKQLSHLALDHGVLVDPTKTHGALADCRLLVELLKKGNYTLEQILAYKNDPWVYIAAIMPKFDKSLNELAKQDGYSWESARGETEPKFIKRWVKKVKSNQLEKEKEKQLAFQREIL